MTVDLVKRPSADIEAAMRYIVARYGQWAIQTAESFRQMAIAVGRASNGIGLAISSAWAPLLVDPRFRKAVRRDRVEHQRVQRQLRVRDRRLARRRRRQWARALACPTCRGRGMVEVPGRGGGSWYEPPEAEPCFDCPASGLRFGYWVVQ